MKILWYKGRQTGPGQGLVVEVEEKEGSGQRVETLPVDEVIVV